MPAPRWLTICGRGARWVGACTLAFGVWTLWLALAGLLAVQVYIVSTNELQVPGFLLRALEERLAASGLRASFGRTAFDPTGRVLIENLKLSLPAYVEPVVTARTVYARLDAWALAAGHFEPRELHVTGATWSVPAMLSPSGRAEDVLRDLDATLVPQEKQLAIEQLVARIAGVAVSLHGAVQLPASSPGGAARLPVADFLAQNYPPLCRQIVGIAEQLAKLNSPLLHLELAPSESRTAIVSATLLAAGYELAAPVPVRARDLRIVTRFPLLGDAPVAARLEFTARELDLPFDATARRVRAVVRGTLHPAQLRYEPRDFQLTADSVAAAGFNAGPVAARLTPGPLPRIEADLVTALFGAPLAVRAETDFGAQTATLHFNGGLSSEIFGPLQARLGVDVRRWFNFAAFTIDDGEARFAPGWKFERLTARVALRGIDAYHVPMDEGHAVIELDGRRLHSPEAFARIGTSFARGSYDHDFATRDFRFLLEGRLDPPLIAGWWPSGWWTNFFKNFEFPAGPPNASVDVQGRWNDGHRSAVFVFADAPQPVIRGAPFERARTRLFLRPAFYDGLELVATRGSASVRGTFTYTTDPVTLAWHHLDVDAVSSLDLATAEQMIGPVTSGVLAPFRFTQAPALRLSGRLSGPAAPGGAHQTVHVAGQSDAEFRFSDFPFERVTFAADVRDDVISVDRIEAGFAGGVLNARAKVFGVGRDRRVSFDGALKDASLGRTVAVLQEYTARKNHTPPSPPGKFVQERSNVRLELAAAAEGRYDDALSYRGAGTVALRGVELGEVKLFGLLSELLRFTALRFNMGKSSFRIEGARVVFPDVKLSGANSAIDAAGTYGLERRQLDFTAKVYPLHESGNLLKKSLEVVLTPLTSILEVKLSGTLDEPKWGLALGLSQPEANVSPSVPATPAPTEAATQVAPAAPPPKPQ